MHPKHRGVALLLSLGSLPIGLAGCNKDDDENTHIGTQGPLTGDGDSGDAPTTGTSTGEPDPNGTSSVASTSSSTSASDPTGDFTTGDFTTGDFTTGEPPDPTTGDINEACILYGERVGMCPGYDAAEAAANCQQILDSGEQLDGQACRETLEALYVCLTKQDCADIQTGTGCGEEFNQIAGDCPMFYYNYL